MPLTSSSPLGLPRSVRVIHFARSASFAYAFFVLAILAWQRGGGAVLWLGLVLQFLIYPHALYAHARRAANPKRAELNHMLLDSILLGAWLAEFGFVPWLGFGLVLATGMNGLINRGPAGFAWGLLLFTAGALGWGLVNGFHPAGEAGTLVTALCVAGALAYAYMVGYIVFVNNRRLGEARQQLLLSVGELQRQQERLEVAAHAFEQMTEAIMVSAADGTVVTVNQAFCELTGLGLEEVVGRPERDFRTACQPPAFYDELYAVVARDGRWTGTTWSRRKNGSLFREWRNVSAIRDEAGRIKYFVSLFFELPGRDAGTAALAAQLASRRG